MLHRQSLFYNGASCHNKHRSVFSASAIITAVNTRHFMHYQSSGSNVLYGGDRSGSNYQYAMKLNSANPGNTSGAGTPLAFSGRLNPGFTKKVNAFMILTLFLSAGIFELPVKEKWVLEKDGYLQIEGSTNVNKFNYSVEDYATPDTLTFFNSADRCVPMTGYISLPVSHIGCLNRIMNNDL